MICFFVWVMPIRVIIIINSQFSILNYYYLVSENFMLSPKSLVVVG